MTRVRFAVERGGLPCTQEGDVVGALNVHSRAWVLVRLDNGRTVEQRRESLTVLAGAL